MVGTTLYLKQGTLVLHVCKPSASLKTALASREAMICGLMYMRSLLGCEMSASSRPGLAVAWP